MLDRKSHEKSGQNQQETGKSCRKSIQIQQIQADGLIRDRQMNLSKEEEEDVQFVEQVAVIFLIKKYTSRFLLDYSLSCVEEKFEKYIKF